MTYFARGFVIAIVISLVAMLGSALLWANYAMLTATSTQATHAYQLIKSERQTATWLGIFLNNLRASWYLVVPAFGLVLFFYIWYNTATILGFESAHYFANASIGARALDTSIIVLLILGLGVLEISAYIFACAENLYVTYLAVNRLGAGERIKKQSWKTWIIYVVLLLVAAIVEAILISAGL
jgi:uncharacterized membrane protein SpoIIM required for sporulation